MNEIDQTELKRNVSDKNTWLRFVFMVIFGLAFHIAAGLAWVIALLQFLAKLFSGKPIDGLTDFGGNLGTYIAQVTQFMTFASDDKPFPFAKFPGGKN